MKYERLSNSARVMSAILAGLMLLAGSQSVLQFFGQPGAEQFQRALVALMSCGACGVMFGLAATTGLSPDILAMLRHSSQTGQRNH